MPVIPAYKPWLPIEWCDYHEKLLVSFPWETVTINQLEIDGVTTVVNKTITSKEELEAYWAELLDDSNVTAEFDNFILTVNSSKKLGSLRYTVGGTVNNSLFNKTNCHIVSKGTVNQYIFEQTADGKGKWVEYSPGEEGQWDLDYYEDGAEWGLEFTQGGYTKRVKMSHYEVVTLMAATPMLISHNLGTVRVSATVYDSDGYEVELVIGGRTLNTITAVSAVSWTFNILIQK